MNEKRKRKSLFMVGGLFMLLILTALLVGAIGAAPSEAPLADTANQADGDWFWETTHSLADAAKLDEVLVVVEGQIGEPVEPAAWNRWTFSDGDAEILANFADELTADMLPTGVTVRIFGEIEDGEMDVEGMQVLEAVSVAPSTTAADVNSSSLYEQNVSVLGELGEQRDYVSANWNYFALTDGSGTTTADLPDKDEMPEVPTGQTMMIFGKVKQDVGDYRIDSNHILLADFSDAPEVPETTEEETAPPAPTTLGATGGLLTGIPEPADADYQAQDLIHEGGRHFLYTSVAVPAALVEAYGSALEKAGWEVTDAGGGGDPFGLFGGGAGLTAEKSDGRYIKFHAGGPVGNTFIDACVWPTKPDNEECDQDTAKTAGGDAALGANANLLANVPEPAKAEFKSENAIQEGGRHYFYFSSENAPAEVITDYQAALEAAGWTIEDSGSGGDPFGLFASGANVTATNEGRYLKVHAGGPPGSTFVDACIWPAQPDDDDCDQDQQNDSAAPGVMGTGGELLADIPEPAGANFQSENEMPEGGRHFYYTSSDAPANIVNKFQAALEATGWNIEGSGGGGDPFGFASGAGMTATNGGRYLKFNAGGPTGSTHIDACVWPAKPSDDDCDQDNRVASMGTAALGSGGELLAGVPQLMGAEFKAEDAIQEGGRHYFFHSSDNGPADIVSGYETALTQAGWNILNSGGDPFGLFGAGLAASDGTRYLKLHAGGPPGSTFVDACIWPSQPTDDDCDQNNQTSGSARLGAGGSLLANIPEPAGAAFQAQNSIQEGGRHFDYTSSNTPADVVGNYETALEANGWTIVSSGGGGDPFGLFASGAGLTATNGSRYLKMNAGGPTGSTHVDVCVWVAKPVDDNCGQNNNNQNRAGNATMGSSGGLLDGVPELAAEFKAEDAIQEGGRHFFFTSSNAPDEVISTYGTVLIENGWEVVDFGGGGDLFGMFGGGAGLTATDGARVIKLNAGGPAGQTFIDACIWPADPVNENCDQNNN